MFKEIRKRITLINLMTLIAFLTIFIVVIILIIWWSFKVSGEAYLINQFNIITGEEESVSSGALINTTFFENLGSEYIIWNDSEGIVSQTVTDNELIEDAYKIMKDGRLGFSKISSDLGTFRIYTNQSELNNKLITVQVFQNITAEASLIPYFIIYLVLIGALGIGALIPISYILAGKSLIPIKKSFDDQKKFIADASHELRSPLTVINSSVDILNLKSDTLVSENQKWIDNISLETQNLSNLISEMLLIAQADNKRLHFDNRPVELSDLSEEVCERILPQIEDHHLVLQTSIEPGIMIKGDKDKFRQLLRIFLDNAIKYTPQGGLVIFELFKSKKNIYIKIKDTGIGIAEKNLDRIFDRFFRCDNARGRDNGSGLGLNIAQTIVSYYDGTIKAESELNKGTQFTISLPISN